MSLLSPHRVGPKGRTRHPTLVIANLVVALTLIAPGLAANPDAKLPGGIPKAPSLVEGYPIPFPQTTDYRSGQGGLLARDLDGDGEPELILAIPSGLVSALRLDGSPLPGWPRTFEDVPQPAFPVGAPATGDLDGDGRLEVVACVASGATPRTNYLYAFGHDGADRPGWPVEIRLSGPQVQTCSSAGVIMADLDGDGMMEVAVAVNLGRVVAFDGDGRPMPGWPVMAGTDALGNLRGINAALSAADLDADGAAETIFIESGFEPRLMAVDRDGRPEAGFPVQINEVVDRQAPAVADLDGDGRPEVIQATLPFTGDLFGGIDPQGEPGGPEPLIPPALHVLRSDGTPAPGWPRILSQGGAWGPLLADLDGDGWIEILQQDGEALYAFDLSGAIVPGFPHTLHRDFNRTQSLASTPWIAADLDGDGDLDLLNVRSNVYLGQSYLRVFGLRASGRSLKGFPFDVEGHRASSDPVVADVSGDGVGDLVLLATEGLNGRWKLMAWDLGGLLPASRR